MNHRLFAAAACLALAACACKRSPHDSAVAVTAEAPIAVGSAAPSFRAVAHDGTIVDLAELRGRPVVVYFYPKDETPGCTKEACAFRDAWDRLAKRNVALVGVSGDDAESHRAFAAHHRLPFALVSDADGRIAAAFGVPRVFGLAARHTVVIGPDGRVTHVHRSVDPMTHAAEIEAELP
jgi:peroxiredoxin Q/BCP